MMIQSFENTINSMKNYIIAIDGYSSTGKSTLARDLAKYFGWYHIDSGAMYRAITLFGIQNFLNPFNQKINFNELISCLDFIQLDFFFNKKNKENEIYLNNINVSNEIRSFLVNKLVSKVAELNAVRSFLLEKEKKLANNKSIVMDGRDIGTVVFPKADLKFFITASIEKRTERRFLEVYPTSLTREQIKKNLIERDFYDIKRKNSPLIKAKDALLIDNSELNLQQTLQLMINCVNNIK